MVLDSQRCRRIALGVKVEHEDFCAGLGKCCSQIDDASGLADATLLVHDRDDARVFWKRELARLKDSTSPREISEFTCNWSRVESGLLIHCAPCRCDVSRETAVPCIVTFCPTRARLATRRGTSVEFPHPVDNIWVRNSRMPRFR